ncbi:MAG: hypothetical protein WBL85_04825 [Sedimentisphaerales bacterium]
MNEANPNEKSDLKYKVYLEERKFLVDAEREQSQSFDKAILTLAGGAFGISLTFIKDIVSNHEPVQLPWLILAWICFIVSMLSTLISFLTSQKACATQREILEALYCDEQDKKSNHENTAAERTSWLNWFSISTFIMGTIFLAIFSIVNLMT